MLFSYEPLQALYTAARELINDVDHGKVTDLTELKLAFGQLERMVAARVDCGQHIELAQNEEYETVQVDQNPLVAVADNGVWVEAWVFVSDKEYGYG